MIMIVPIGEWAGGVLGAIVVVLAFFGPTAVLTFIVGRLWNKLEKWPWRRSIQQGLAPVSVGLLLAGCFTMAKGSHFWVRDGNDCGGRVLLLLLNYKINPALLILAGAVIGVLSFSP